MTSGSILIVEDDSDDAFFMVRALHREFPAVEVEVCPDPVGALERLLNPARRVPSVVFLDLRMPKLAGHEVLLQLRANPRTRYLPVVVITASSLELDILGSYRGGANSHVRKPLHIEELAEKVRRTAHYWLGLNSVPDLEPLPPIA